MRFILTPPTKIGNPAVPNADLQSSCSLQAVAAGAPEIWVVGNYYMTAFLADDPVRPL
jgi:hypothetical protein